MTGEVSNRRTEKGCCNVQCLKLSLFIFNLLFLASGCIVIGVGLWILTSSFSHAHLLTTATFFSASVLFISAGILVIINTVFGCVAVIQENRCYLLFYTFTILFIFLLEIVAAILSYLYQYQIGTELEHTLKNTINDNYGIKPDMTDAIDAIQLLEKCCGDLSPYDWRESNWKLYGDGRNSSVPDSCCRTPSYLCGVRDHPSNVWQTGCRYGINNLIADNMVLLGIVGSAVAIFQALGLLLSCRLYVKFKEIESY